MEGFYLKDTTAKRIEYNSPKKNILTFGKFKKNFDCVN